MKKYIAFNCAGVVDDAGIPSVRSLTVSGTVVDETGTRSREFRYCKRYQGRRIHINDWWYK
jgi:hypothetical protein